GAGELGRGRLIAGLLAGAGRVAGVGAGGGLLAGFGAWLLAGLLAGLVSRLLTGFVAGGCFAGLAGEFAGYAVGEPELGGLVAEDGVGGAFDAVAELFEGAGDAVLFAAGLLDEATSEELAAGVEFLVGAADALFADDVVE